MKGQTIKLNKLTFAIAAAVAASASSVAAQESGYTLEEVTVTAQKRVQTLQEVPISVATMQDEKVDAMLSGGGDILNVAAAVPGLYAESSNGRAAPRFYIRGLGNTDFDLAASQPVSVVMDDVVMENVILKSFPLFDVEQVEVIRGPQGTLFGRNTTAGIVKFDTVKPSFDTDAKFKSSVGSFGTQDLEGAFGTSIIDGKLAARFAAVSRHRNDWIDNDYTGEKDAMGGHRDVAYRGSFLWTPTDDLSVLLSHQERELEGTASIFRANIFTTGKDGLNENYDRDTVWYDDTHNNPQGIDASGTNLKVEWDFGGATITSVTSLQKADSFSKGDIDGGWVDFATGATGPGFIPFGATTEDQSDQEQFTQEVRLATDLEGPFNWQAGWFYFDSDLKVTSIDGFFGATDVTHKNETWAVFGQATYDVSDKLTLTGGLRYTDDEKGLDVGEQNVDGFAAVIGVASVQDYDPVRVQDDQVSWEVAANYDVDGDSSVFARIANGFRAQSIQARDVAFEGAPSVAEAETINSIEAGYKADLMEGRARLNAAVFYYVVDDMQLSAIGGANNGNSLMNADKGVGYGFEADLEFAATENLLLTGGIGYAKTELQDSTLATAPCGSGQCTVLDPLDANGNALLDGNPFQAAPEMTFNFTARYSYPLENGELYAFTDWVYTGETNLSLYEAVEFKTDGQYEGGLRTGWMNDTFDVALFGRNITDEENIKGFIDFNNNTGFVNEPTVWGVDFSVTL
ncbi:TonB-dependent receptor [Biformimicrobium ophioploci]|uniref:TonB-dependent receptor n=1 Tax=Biformimicrobium ophioploci TaxID=3036711 RepID=A0ABQ6LXS4_9GAMM|nr:TonB-dependent receptor [Microbulbifer sp. NKW57]GMG86869.1 TonB-dependent receptor [Microbulbifer sp. NKW57]